jgi:hypothetical protein
VKAKIFLWTNYKRGKIMRDIRVEVRDYTDANYYEEVGEVDEDTLTPDEIQDIVDELENLVEYYHEKR